MLGRCLFQQDGAGADTQRKQHGSAQAEGECDRRAADEHIVVARAQHLCAIGIAGRQHVAMEMHRALGLAGGAGGEGDQAHIVGQLWRRP